MRDEKEDRVRYTNCYRCSVRIPLKESLSIPKSEEGEIIIWCDNCRKKTFYKKRKLIKRKQPFCYGDAQIC